MHELSIATSLIDVVMAQLIESGAGRVVRVIVEVGELSGVVPEALRTAFCMAARQEPAMTDAVLELRVVPVSLYCPSCDAEQPAVSVQALRCRVCDTPSARVVRGWELDVVSIEVDDAAANAGSANENSER